MEVSNWILFANMYFKDIFASVFIHSHVLMCHLNLVEKYFSWDLTLEYHVACPHKQFNLIPLVLNSVHSPDVLFSTTRWVAYALVSLIICANHTLPFSVIALLPMCGTTRYIIPSLTWIEDHKLKIDYCCGLHYIPIS